MPRSVPSGAVSIRCAPDDAEVYLDDARAGVCASLRTRPLVLPEGKRRLEIRRTGYFVHYSDVEVSASRQRTLQVTLRPIPDV